MAERYRMETGVKVEFQLHSSAGRDYWNKVQAAAQANTLPDIIGLTDDPEMVARYARAGKLLEMTQEMRADNNAWEYSFLPRAVNALYFPPNNIYGVKGNTYWGVPLSVMNIQIFYNKNLFKKAGLDPENPPQTWPEFIEAGQKLRQAKIEPIVTGFGDLWIGQMFFRTYAWTLLGPDKIRALYLGDLPYTSPECLQVMKLFAEWRDKSLFYPGVISLSNKEAEIIFAHDKAAMLINGSWGVNVLSQMNPDLEYGVMPFPKPVNAAYPMYVVGGLDRGAAVTAQSKHKAAAVKFLRWLTALPQQQRWARVPNGFPAVVKAQEMVSPNMQAFVVSMKDINPALFLEERAEVLETMNKGMQSLLIKESTPEKVLKQIQQKKEEMK